MGPHSFFVFCFDIYPRLNLELLHLPPLFSEGGITFLLFYSIFGLGFCFGGYQSERCLGVSGRANRTEAKAPSLGIGIGAISAFLLYSTAAKRHEILDSLLLVGSLGGRIGYAWA